MTTRIKTLIAKLCPNGVKYKKIIDICERQKGISITAGEMKKLDKENAPIRIFAAGNTVVNVNYEDVPEKSIIKKKSIIVKSRGNIGFEYYTKPFTHKNEMWSYSVKSDLIELKYIYYILQNNVDEFQNIAKSGKLPQISTGDIDNYKVPVPPIEVQKCIVSILDRFDKLCNDISEGLPAEIEARQKQYEYYRDKLLTFKEKRACV